MIKITNKKENIFGDEIAFIEQWDFSTANLNEENRLMAITKVASICYQSPKALGSQSLYDRLYAESNGLPSSSFEFVPVIFSDKEYWELIENKLPEGFVNNPLEKFGEWILDGKFLLTNFRAIVYLFEAFNIDLREYFNTQEECAIIKEHFKVFLYKVDFPTRSQMVRHRINWQELSRRYVSGKRVPFDFYISEKMKVVESTVWLTDQSGIGSNNDISTNDILDICLNHYYQALEKGIKPQEARRIIPQAAYTQIWGAFQPTQLQNYFRLRDDSHAQWEIQQTAITMKELLGLTNEK